MSAWIIGMEQHPISIPIYIGLSMFEKRNRPSLWIRVWGGTWFHKKNLNKISYLSPFNNGECWSKHLSCLCLQKYTCQKYRRKKNIHPTCSVYPGVLPEVPFVLILCPLLLNWQAKVPWTPKGLPSVLVEAVPTASGPLGLTPWPSAGGHDEPCVLKLGNWFKICYAKNFEFKVRNFKINSNPKFVDSLCF